MFDQVSGVTYTINRMKTRVLLTMLIIFIVLSGVWITCGTIFVVREIDVVDMKVQTAEALSESEVNEIIAHSGLKGKNILFSIHQDQITKNIKLVDPMFKLQSVTAKFPNRIVLTVSRRVPIYYDSTSDLLFDSDMCVVEGNKSACINITGANLTLNDGLMVGDLAVGKDARTQGKIDQLKIIGSYFNDLNGFQISYDDSKGVVDSKLLCLKLQIKTNVKFVIKVKPTANFWHALDFTNFIYTTEENYAEGEYRTLFQEDNSRKVYTKLYMADGSSPKKDGNGKDIVYNEK